MDCLHCKAAIDDDSFFCDQCGAEVLLCSLCRRPGKGKRCVSDGKELVAAKGLGAPAQVPVPPPSQAAPTRTTPIPAPAPQAPAGGTERIAGPAATAGGKLRLAAPQHGIDLVPVDRAILGRTQGAHAGSLGRFTRISSSHLEIRQEGGGWAAVDLGSTNGTKYNGNRLQKQVPQPLAHGATLTLADVDFIVHVEA